MSKREQVIEVIGRGIARRENSVLLCRSTTGGYFYLPGGHVEFSESAATAVQREFFEETGLSVRVGCIGWAEEHVFEANCRIHHEINIVFHVEHVNGEWPDQVRSMESNIAFEWVDIPRLRSVDIRPAHHSGTIADALNLGCVQAWVSSGAR
ncbi:MAG: NUDIX domain-containing protein [Phycisphaerae bacterium]|nr:NUDIX domain-containing protein [Phycisphaerae bacterium]